MYANDYGMTEVHVRPHKVYWGQVDGHSGEQWFVEGLDLATGDIEIFALKNIIVPSSESKYESITTGGRNGHA